MININDNLRHRKFTGVEKFHRAGYFGKRVKAATGETWDLKDYDFNGQAKDPLNYGVYSTGQHAVQTAATFFVVAPEATLYMLPSTKGYFSGDDVTYQSGFFDDSVDVIESEGITEQFTSMLCSRHRKFFNDLKAWYAKHPEFKPFFCAGNDGDERVSGILDLEEVFGCAAYTLMVSGEVVPASYSSTSPAVDFSGPTMIPINPKATKPSDNGHGGNAGTSFSTPWLCGMAALVDDFFLDVKGSVLTRDSMYKFFKDHCKDIGAKGKDDKCGWGAVILPDPRDIDISKYETVKEMEKMKFADEQAFSKWAIDAIKFCSENGLMMGKAENKFCPADHLTREEAAVMMMRLVNFMKKS